MTGQLHAGIAFYDPCYFVSQSLIGWLLMGAFNPIDVSFDYGIAQLGCKN